LGQCAQEGIAISRGQQQSVINTAKSQDTTNFDNAQSAFGQTQNDIGDYTNALNRLRLSMLRKATRRFLPGVLVQEFQRAELPELATDGNEHPAAVRTEISDGV
jgi:hypothetical protein